MTSNSTVIFVDGPTASGKDTLIEELAQRHLDSDDTRRLVRLSAVDYALRDDPNHQRQYGDHGTDEAAARRIYTGHLRLLEHLREVCVQEPTLALVNRSYMSFLAYNLLPLMNKGVDGKHLTLQEELGVESYARFFTQLSESASVLFVVTTPSVLLLENKAQVLIDRMLRRNDHKPIDQQWVMQMVKNYAVTIWMLRMGLGNQAHMVLQRNDTPLRKELLTCMVS